MAGGPTRRAVLVASAAAVPVLLSACRGMQALGTPPPPPPDVRQLRAAIEAEQLMIARYRSAISAASGGSASYSTVSRLTGILADHRQHLVQLSARLVVPAGSSPPAPGARASLPSGLAAAIGALETAEQDASTRLAGLLLDAPPSLAQLLASISASEATHSAALRSLRRTR